MTRGDRKTTPSAWRRPLQWRGHARRSVTGVEDVVRLEARARVHRLLAQQPADHHLLRHVLDDVARLALAARVAATGTAGTAAAHTHTGRPRSTVTAFAANESGPTTTRARAALSFLLISRGCLFTTLPRGVRLASPPRGGRRGVIRRAFRAADRSTCRVCLRARRPRTGARAAASVHECNSSTSRKAAVDPRPSGGPPRCSSRGTPR